MALSKEERSRYLEETVRLWQLKVVQSAKTLSAALDAMSTKDAVKKQEARLVEGVAHLQVAEADLVADITEEPVSVFPSDDQLIERGWTPNWKVRELEEAKNKELAALRKELESARK